MIAELATFVLSRAAERRAAAQACINAAGSERAGGRYDDDSGTATRDAFPSYPWGNQDAELAFMAGPGHPDRVLGEAAAAQKLAEHALAWAETSHSTPAGWTPEGATAYRMAMEWALQRLAAVDSGHPDYRSEWAT